MSSALPLVAILFALSVFHPLAAQGPDSVESQAQRVDAAIERVLESKDRRDRKSWDRESKNMRAKLRVARAAGDRAYEAAARLRQKHELLDSDPETLDVIVSASDRARQANDPIIEEYLRHKKAHVEAKAKLQELEQRFGSCRLTGVNLGQMTVNSTSREVADVFKKLSELIENGEVTDPNPDDAKSEVTFNSTNKETADYYIRKKAKYLELKIEAAEARIQHGAAIVDESRRGACFAYQAAVLARQKNQIVDPDPESAGAIVLPKDDPAVAKYHRHKKTYLEIKAEIEIADAVFPITVLQSEAKTAEEAMTKSFAKVTGLLQGGKVTDPKPDDPNSAVSFDESNKETATAYIAQKANYLALKNRSTRAHKALAAAKARENR